MATIKTHRRLWFYFVIAGGAIPMTVRFIVYCHGSTEHFLEISEVIFFGLTMAITNLSVVGSVEIEDKMVVIIASSMLSLLLGVLLGFSMIETQPDKDSIHYWLFRLMIGGFVFASCLYSYKVNERVFIYEGLHKRIKKKK
jgi:hypothetical protein